MKITSEQVEKMNSKCKNGWQIDVMYLASWGEKKFFKQIKIDDDAYLQFTLGYNSKNQIYIRVTKYNRSSTAFVSEGGGKLEILDETFYPRKNVNKLIEYTSKLNDDELIKIKDKAKIVEVIGMIPSNNF